MSLSHGVSTQRDDGDCLPAAVASLLALPVELLPKVDHEADDWIGGYNEKLREAGWPFELITTPVGQPMIKGRWIAVVRSLIQEGWHAVVMEDYQLYHDPGRVAKYQVIEPEKAKCAVLVVATGEGFGPHRDPTWEAKELNY